MWPGYRRQVARAEAKILESASVGRWMRRLTTRCLPTQEDDVSRSDVPGGRPPANDGPDRYGDGPDGGARTFGAGALAAVAVAVLVVAGLGGYLIGHSSGDDAGTKSGEQAGVQQGVERGRAEITAQYRRGQPAYKAIFDAGKAEGFGEGLKRGTAQGEKAGQAQGERQGERTGFEQGDRVGVTTGEAEGVRQGAAAVLGGFGTWTDGAFYIVTVGQSSTAGVPYTITSRSQIQPGTNYKLCNDGGSQICQSAVTSAASATPPANAAEDGGGAGAQGN
jgi:hypothetical protein